MSQPLPKTTPLPAAPDAAFDRFAGLVRGLLGVPTALVTLVSADQQVFPGALGLPEPWQTARCTPLSHSFCQHVVTSARPLVVTDAREHPLLADDLAIPDLHVIAYAGVPLTDATGTVLGSLCAIDDQPRTWTEEQLALLAELAAACSSELQLRLERTQAQRERSRIELALSASQVGTYEWDLTTDTLTWDPEMIAMYGYTADTFTPTIAAFSDRVHPEDLERVNTVIAAALATPGDFAAEYRIVLPGGSTRWIHGRGRVLTTDTGQPHCIVGSALDTTDTHDGDARTTRLLTAMPSGFLSMDRDWHVTLVNPAAETLLGQTQEQLAGRTIWEAFPDTVGNEFEHGYRTAMNTGVPQTIHAYYPAPLDAWYDVLCWPSPDGLSLFFTNVTERTRTAEQAQAAAGRLRLLAAVSDAVVQATDTRALLDTLPRRLVPALAEAAVISLLGADGRARDVSCWHTDPQLLTELERYRADYLLHLSAEAPAAQVLATGQARHLSVQQLADLSMSPSARSHLNALGPLRASVLPLSSQGRVTGLLTLLRAADRPVDPDLDLVAADIADRIGAAIETERLRHARTQLAEDLQRSLLSAPPEPDHAEVLVRYLPAAEAARVGGDWYDAFLQPDGTTMIVIGDVAGHDTAAAATMGQLRGLLRGIATYSGAGPAEVLRGLDASMQVLQINTLATAAVARFEQTPEEVERGVTRMVWANAGHPPPIVIHPDGTFQVLAGWKADLLLGVNPAVQRTEQVTVLDRGATVLLYTDGLVERRDTDLDDGILRLTDAVTDLAHTSLDELCTGIIRRLVDDRPDDDVALVAVRLHRQDRPRPAEAGPQRIPDGVPQPAHPAQ